MKVWFVALVTLLFITACSEPREQIHLTGPTMGTTYNVKYFNANNSRSPADMQKTIDELLEQVNDQMSTYRKTSELSLFNQYKGSEPFTVSKETALVTKEAVRLNKLTRGALDVTVGPLVNLWGFGPEARPEVVPTDEELATRRAIVGIENLTVTDTTLAKSIPDLYVDLSTIAKGWGVDVVADFLEAQGVVDYMVEIGGEIRMKGVNREKVGWRIAIEKPDVNERAIQEIIEPGDMAVATSGDYRNYFERDGIRYSHIIEPKTGKPISHKVVSVTALDPSCMTADGLATGLMVLGEKVGLEVANANNIPVFMVVKTEDGYKEVYSEAFSKYLK
ncbi:FAD:protein FMN transferase [Vibrio hannami]|uniref:FAD:protein FMN transferase n=1 Tax=Vibrio hannami TaxID=2717094 RepID=UPI00240F441F|nr:FAD:protein FMN transferase [Vibrio hannami]MDG3087377.1 FAD:protein FMN transferase [Vibrio hannami]